MTEEEAKNLSGLGARAVNASSIEEEVIRKSQGLDATSSKPTNDDEGNNVRDAQAELRAVRRELRAVSSEASRLRGGLSPSTDANEQPNNEEIDHNIHTVLSEQNEEGMLGGGELQQAMLQQRIAGLEAREKKLVSLLESSGADTEVGRDIPPSEQIRELFFNSVKSGKKRNGKNRLAQKIGKSGGLQSSLTDADLFDAMEAAGSSLVETERDRLIRIGILTPFDKLDGFERRVQNESTMSAIEANASIARVGEKVRSIRANRHTTKLVPASDLPQRERETKKMHEGFWRSSTSGRVAPPRKKQRHSTLSQSNVLQLQSKKKSWLQRIKKTGTPSMDMHSEEYLQSERNSFEEDEVEELSELEELLDEGGLFDDADDDAFERRQIAFSKAKDILHNRHSSHIDGGNQESNGSENTSSDIVHDEPCEVIFEGGYRIPADIYGRLFEYQKTAVKWMWELHNQRAGGIIADEMGLGKTIQVIAFLAGLHNSGLFKPTLIVCPATVLKQWLREIRAWYPRFRVAILHDSLGFSQSRIESKNGNRKHETLVRIIRNSDSGILLTTYDQLRLKSSLLLPIQWGYAILDEGHKIRNPDADITLVTKQLATVHRIIMTGSPIQNKLTELWSLFDFVFPGKLGTLPIFQAQFSIPIQFGGYANATPVQVSAAYKCSVILRDLIAPYMLRRRKLDVASSLPKKTERVLFCSLSSEQREMYRSYLSSKELAEILAGKRGALAGIDILRKICNHPDLLERNRWEAAADYGNVSRSGKLTVLQRLLQHWSSDEERSMSNKVLVFTQTQQVLDIVEKLVVSCGWNYHRMDGGTSISHRSRIIDDFNTNPEIFVFLLTTRVGGLGVNLTSANKCVIFDPDWNPSTDVQARERAWRIGQSREVAVYRLITSGTIEEKIYHRQVYKHFLTDRVLQDPRQKRYFKARDLSDLFTLGEEYAEGTETGEIFATLGTEIDVSEVTEKMSGDCSAKTCMDENKKENDLDGDINDRSQANISEKNRSSPSAEAITEKEENGDQNGSGDAHILKDLLDGAGVLSALDHERIEGANRPEKRIADREATKIAAKAAEALKKSYQSLRSVPINQPTWTGRCGTAGAPRFGTSINPRLLRDNDPNSSQSQKSAYTKKLVQGGHFVEHSEIGSSGRFGSKANVGALPSSVLLARLRERKSETVSASESDPDIARGRELAKRVSQFLKSKGGTAYSDDVAGAFQGEIGPNDAALFRGVLRQVATFQRRSDKRKNFWILRPEFAALSGS